MPDHLHLLVGLRPDAALSELVRDIKANSSRFINEKRWVPGRFSWQEGFGAFSYSRSQLGAVIRYIENQQKHHAKKSFLDEYTALLDKFEVQYDERYIFKPIDGDGAAAPSGAASSGVMRKMPPLRSWRFIWERFSTTMSRLRRCGLATVTSCGISSLGVHAASPHDGVGGWHGLILTSVRKLKRPQGRARAPEKAKG